MHSTTHAASAPALQQDLGQIEQRIKATLRAQLGDDVFGAGFNQLKLETCIGNVATLSVATSFFRSWVERNYHDALLSACPAGTERVNVELRSHATPQRTQKRRELRPEIPEVEEPLPPVAPPKAELIYRSSFGRIEGSLVDARNNFEAFVLTASNRMPHAAALQLAELSAEDTPQFILHVRSNEPGCGRTHLLHAMTLVAKDEAQKVLYMTGERFIAAYYSFEPKCNFVTAFDGLDMLIVDDVEPIIRDEAVAAFTAILRGMHGRDARIVTSAREEPANLPCYKMTAGAFPSPLVALIQPLDRAQRCAVVTRLLQEKVATASKFLVKEDAIAYITQQSVNGHQVEQIIVQCFLWWQTHRKPVTVEVAGAIVGSITTPVTRLIKIDDIIKLVARRFAVSRAELLSDRRHRSIVWPRQIGMYLAKTMTSRSLPEIGRRFGDRDHTTVLHSIRKIEKTIKDSPSLATELEDMKASLTRAT